MTHLVNTAITTLQQLGLVFSAIHRSSECVIYATLDVQETAFAANIIFEGHTPRRRFPGTHPGTTPPGNCTWQSLSSTGRGGRSWVSVT